MWAKMRSNILTQLIATSGVLVLQTQTGIIDGWTSPNMARLTEANSTIPLTLPEAAWLASYLKLGRFVSVILMPIFIDLAGSKKAVLYTFIPVSIGWILTILAKSALTLYVARFLNGITYGLSFGCFPIYLGEISTPALRGTFTAIATFGWPLGVLIGTAGETHLPEVVSCSVYLVPCILGVLLFMWLPDSPYHLVKRKDPKRALRSLEWYRGRVDTETEMEEIIEFVESTSRVTFLEKMKQLRLPSIRRPVMLVTLVYTCPQICGVFNVVFYMQIILANAKSYLIEPSEVVVYMNVILVVSAVVSANLIDKLGRRILLIVSMVLMTIGYVALGLHYFLLDNVKVDPINIQILPIVSIILVIVPFSTFYSPVMNATLGEMFPDNIKSTAAVIATLSAAFIGFIATLVYQPLITAIGETYVFWIYAVFMASILPVVLFLLPETKGKSLQEIQKFIKK